MYTLEEGQKFERYRILRMLGKSTTGISYEAEESKPQRRVLLKLIYPWSRLPDATRRQFFRDMQILGSLTHPLLTTILNYGDFNGQLYIARSFVEYGSISDHPGRIWFNPPLNIAIAITYTQQIAQAVSYIHNNGFIHGSLTFTNILTIHEPQATSRAPLMLSDTGLACLVRRIAPDQNALLPVTAAPEQHKKHVTAASDQYSLAVLLYFWLTGHLPFIETNKSSAEIEQLKRTESVPSLCTLNPDVTPAQEYVINKALSPDPRARYSSIKDFATELTTLEYTPTTIISQSSNPSASRTQPIPPRQVSVPETSANPEKSSIYTINTKQTLSTNISSQQVPAPEASLAINIPNQVESFIYQLKQMETSLGHAGDSDILLDQSTKTSRHHALLKYERDHYCIMDNRSTHGVYVNQHKLGEKEMYHLQNGDTIQIGDYTLTFYNEIQQASPRSVQQQTHI